MNNNRFTFSVHFIRGVEDAKIIEKLFQEIINSPIKEVADIATGVELFNIFKVF